MQLKGIYAPIVTPFNTDESINYPVLEQLKVNGRVSLKGFNYSEFLHNERKMECRSI